MELPTSNCDERQSVLIVRLPAAESDIIMSDEISDVKADESEVKTSRFSVITCFETC